MKDRMRPCLKPPFTLPPILALALSAPFVLGGCGGGSGGGNSSLPGLATSRVAFQSDRDGNQEIYLMNGDGTGQVRLTDNASDDLQPAFNRDGSLIAFRSQRTGDASAELYVMNGDGTNQHAVTHNSFDDAEPSFAQGNNTLVFKSTRNGQSDIFTLNLDTGVEKQLTNDVAFDEDPVFLPDGRVLYSSNRSGSFQLYLLKNGAASALPREGTENQFFPDASRDGRVAFVSDLDGNFEIYVMSLNGQNRKRLTTNEVSDLDPVFSPDGTRIYYASLIDGNYNLYVTNADGSGETRRLTTQPSAERLPDVR